MQRIWKFSIRAGFGTLCLCSIFLNNLVVPAASDPAISPSIIQKIKLNAETRFRTSAKNLRVKSTENKQFDNSCLELPAPTEKCDRREIDGWIVSLEDNIQTYTYHTNATGRNLRARPALKFSAASKIQQLAAKDLNIPAEKLRIVDSLKYYFKNDCLELLEKCSATDRVKIDGWKVLVSDDSNDFKSAHRRIYHLDKSADRILLDREATASPVRIYFDRYEDSPSNKVIFTSTSSAWGEKYIETLTNDGKIVRRIVQIGADAGEVPDRLIEKKISLQKLQNFKKILLERNFIKFNGIAYHRAVVDGAFTTLQSKSSTVTLRGTSLEDLPPALRVIWSTWDELLPNR
jgi:hypothetical protein